MSKYVARWLIFISLFSLTPFNSAIADNQLIDKVYHPYVLANEREIEWRYLLRSADSGNQLAQRLGYGFALTEKLAIEGYIIASRDQTENFTFHSFEAEARWMLTEQGQYDVDLGMLFEIEHESKTNNTQATVGVLAEKEFGKTSLTGNFFLLYNWGNQAEQELTNQFRLQYRYRFKPQVQPGIEIYTDDEFIGIGPAFLGKHKFDRFKRLKWEAAYILGFNGESKDNTVRFAIEYEF